MSQQNRTRKLATYASHLNFDNLPVKFMEKAKAVILDTIGVIPAASLYPVERLITRFAQNQGGRPQATRKEGTGVLKHFIIFR
jgi:2-methylcitrate dehydratase PrpD